MKAPREEILRYLGSMGHAPDERLCTRIDDAVSAVTAAASPRSVFRRFGFDGSLIGTGYSPAGKDVLRQLDGCSAVYLFAATLGNGVERIEEQAFARGDSLGAVLLDAAASCLIESFCDDECERIARSEDVTLTSRFSCGYGDYPLEHQADIIRLLDAPRRIGLHVSESGMLMPRKSVTALIGVLGNGYSPADAAAHTADKCRRCAALNCPYRKAAASYDNGGQNSRSPA